MADRLLVGSKMPSSSKRYLVGSKLAIYLNREGRIRQPVKSNQTSSEAPHVCVAHQLPISCPSAPAARKHT